MNTRKNGRYTAQHVAGLLAINKRTLFNWEGSGKLPKAKRDPMNNYRYYTDDDIVRIKRITKR
jgi:DNA-binding transcriptional MerR regulator